MPTLVNVWLQTYIPIMYILIHAGLHIYKQVPTYIHMYVCTDLWMCEHALIHTCMHIYIYAQIFMHVYPYIYILLANRHTYTHVCPIS